MIGGYCGQLHRKGKGKGRKTKRGGKKSKGKKGRKTQKGCGCK